jgi:hypothetical protein
LNARAKNWRQKARISAKGLDSSWLPAGAERESEVIIVMTQAHSVFTRGLCRVEAPSGAMNTSFGLIY